MNINIQDLVTKTFGGNGGNLFSQRGIKSIAIRHGKYVDAIIINGIRFGGEGGNLSETISLDDNEYLARIKIRHGKYIDYLSIATNKGQILEGGGDGGEVKILRGEIVAIGGRSGIYLDEVRILGDFINE